MSKWGNLKEKLLILVILIVFSLFISKVFLNMNGVEKFTLFKKKAVGVMKKNKDKVPEETVSFLEGKTEKKEDPMEKNINYLRSVITPTDENLARQDLIDKTKSTKKPLPVLPTSKLGGQGTCKFLSSSACSSEYPVYMGASLGIPDNSGFSLSCNSDLTKPAKGIAIMDGGKLESIVLLDKGEGYQTPPQIRIKGQNGHGAKCSAMLDDEGAISKIVIENPGTDYTGTPQVEIDLPNVSSSCHLCCKQQY